MTLLLLTSCNENVFIKDYMEYFYKDNNISIAEFNINNYPLKTVGLGNDHYYKKLIIVEIFLIILLIK